ncbi:MAG: helix-turn-helix transcriptional regulator [Chitinophagales bacterium]|nr:helix-turn-helix transcriptional regulator [Chitinophagales bacterium]
MPNKLREYRKHQGLRQLDVATKLGFSSTDRISKWERGLTYPHLLNLFKLCKLYNVYPHELYDGLLSTAYVDMKRENINN